MENADLLLLLNPKRCGNGHRSYPIRMKLLSGLFHEKRQGRKSDWTGKLQQVSFIYSIFQKDDFRKVWRLMIVSTNHRAQCLFVNGSNQLLIAVLAQTM